jgi:Zn-dependent oligopeptidase
MVPELCGLSGLLERACAWRAEKRGGAWMDEVVGQSRLFAEPGSAVRLPVAHMVRTHARHGR